MKQPPPLLTRICWWLSNQLNEIGNAAVRRRWARTFAPKEGS